MTMPTPDIFDTPIPPLKVGLCQVYTEEWAVSENLGRTLEAIEDAARQGAEIVITPECVLHGYASNETENYREKLLEAATTLQGEQIQSIRDKARELGIYVMVGFAERTKEDQLHNTAALISNDGTLLNVYRKVHCRPFEHVEHKGGFVPGDTFSVSALQHKDKACKAGTMICFDREIPETVRCLRSLGAEIIFCPLATNTSDMTKPSDKPDNESITRCRAAENEVFIVVVNHAGRFNGGSFAVGPAGELLHQMGAEAGVKVLDVPVGAVREKFHNDPLGWMGWGYRRQDVYNTYLS